MSVATAAVGNRVVSAEEERRVIVASSVGTVFEWYDFYLYAILAPFFAALFFPPRTSPSRSSARPRGRASCGTRGSSTPSSSCSST